ncbi:MAG: CDP-alcohol phosphatidyltransferase family protein [Micavibrio aeruginosavorus]|uniref:CDP-alcohol phosphatidyltransferase family protein n=1 Tax=Micavibrio aeruginosavorus TaxID=349221 RepID=A0A7T5R1P1_9BACT|nr:MAG: CDP-alcohol phosphatidyltransferase family protein [Micavibrio aeruginosavorus]
MTSAEQNNRRPLKARQWAILQNMTEVIGKTSIHPNHISISSIGFSALAAVCLWLTAGAKGSELWLYAWLVPVFLLGRGACNILDGLVAVEGGKKTPSGELFNDIPDRISDILVLVAAGYAVASWPGGVTLGWAAALLAVMTAYVRTLARGMGLPADFQGPMAKARRMVLIAAGAGAIPLEIAFLPQGSTLYGALIVIVAGCLLTVYRRARTAYRGLESGTGQG